MTHCGERRDLASRGLAYDRGMIDISWLLVAAVAAFAVGMLAGVGLGVYLIATKGGSR